MAAGSPRGSGDEGEAGLQGRDAYLASADQALRQVVGEEVQLIAPARRHLPGAVLAASRRLARSWQGLVAALAIALVCLGFVGSMAAEGVGGSIVAILFGAASMLGGWWLVPSLSIGDDDPQRWYQSYGLKGDLFLVGGFTCLVLGVAGLLLLLLGV